MLIKKIIGPFKHEKHLDGCEFLVFSMEIDDGRIIPASIDLNNPKNSLTCEMIENFYNDYKNGKIKCDYIEEKHHYEVLKISLKELISEYISEKLDEDARNKYMVLLADDKTEETKKEKIREVFRWSDDCWEKYYFIKEKVLEYASDCSEFIDHEKVLKELPEIPWKFKEIVYNIS